MARKQKDVVVILSSSNSHRWRLLKAFVTLLENHSLILLLSSKLLSSDNDKPCFCSDRCWWTVGGCLGEGIMLGIDNYGRSTGNQPEQTCHIIQRISCVASC